MDRKFFRHLYKKLRLVSPWVFLAVAIISAIVCIFALRNNNLTALKLRDEVVATDKANGDIEAALRKLRTYIYSHMNTDLSAGGTIQYPVQLKYRYERLVFAEQQKLSTQNERIYTEAQAECEKRFPKGLSGSGRIPCITDYVASRGIQQTPVPDSLYKFNFVSPRWSPDLAGWSLVIASISFALFVIRFGLERWVRTEIRDLQ